MININKQLTHPIPNPQPDLNRLILTEIKPRCGDKHSAPEDRPSGTLGCLSFMPGASTRCGKAPEHFLIKVRVLFGLF